MPVTWNTDPRGWSAHPGTTAFNPPGNQHNPPAPGVAQGRIVPGQPGSPDYQPPAATAGTPGSTTMEFGNTFGGGSGGIGPGHPQYAGAGKSGVPLYGGAKAIAGNADGSFTPWAPGAGGVWGPIPGAATIPAPKTGQGGGTGLPGTGAPGGGAGGLAGAIGSIGQILAQIPKINLPTQQSQNQLLALAHQQANPVQAMNRLGNNGIQTGSQANVQRLLGDMSQTIQQGALGAAKLGVEDQLLRDKQLLTGVVGLGGLENDRQSRLADRQRLGIDAQQEYMQAILSLLGAFNFGDLTGGVGDILGAF